jgi:hypothetical protein
MKHENENDESVILDEEIEVIEADDDDDVAEGETVVA